MSDTIAAIATGSALTAIGIIRLSGERAIEITNRVFSAQNGIAMTDCEDRRLVYGKACNSRGELLDYCLCTVSRAPSSYTGEDTAELQCHGSPVVLRAILNSLFDAGARQAAAGEFTKRAFLNGRMDLTQAEAVTDLIHAETEEMAKNAAGQLGGSICRKTDAVYDSLKAISAHYHAVLDYPDEDIDPFELAEYSATLRHAEQSLEMLLQTFERGRLMQAGISTVILGRPNVGKSSLLNALLGYERAIVTNIPGTTRDTISERVNLGGVLLRLIDTAGIRDTADPLECMGVERSLAAISEAELALVLVDSSQDLCEEDFEIIKSAETVRHLIVVETKIDLPEADGARSDFGLGADSVVRVSSMTGEGLSTLGEAVSLIFSSKEDVSQGEILTNARHADAVSRALGAIRLSREAMDLMHTPDIVLSEAERAMSALGELTGRTVRDDITSEIFSRFCVGK